MKICGIICEFNPFHNGHKYLLERARILSGCDKLLCIMSGSFTQRGEMALLDKYERARQAIFGGADCVLELPTPFAVSPAEIFAEGAIKLLSAIPDVSHIAFGCEDESFDFSNAAKILSCENGKFKKILSENLKSGESYIKSYALAAKEALNCGDELIKPNNILGLEYAKAILKLGADIKILPIARKGASYDDGVLHENFSSATAIRDNISNPLVKCNVPEFVKLENLSNLEEYKMAARFALFNETSENLSEVCGCGEGLENRLKSLAHLPYDSIVTKATTRRYSSSRIHRILLSNLLKLYKKDIDEYLKGDLYLKVLAVKRSGADVLKCLAKSEYPVVCDGIGKELCGVALNCFKKDVYAYALFNFLNGRETRRKGYDYMITV